MDELTVDVLCDDVCPILLQNSIFTYFQAPEWYQQASEDERMSNTVGFGPYRLEEWRQGELIRLEAYENYVPSDATDGRKPSIRDVTYFIAPERATRIAMVLTRQAGWAWDIGVANRDKVPAFKVGGSATVFGGLIDTLWHPQLKDKRVRQAINYAIDCEKIVDTLYDGLATCRGSLAGPESLGITPGPYPYDPVRAKQLLAEAGYPNGFEIQILTRSGRIDRDLQTAEAIRDMWVEVGLDAQIGPPGNRGPLDSGEWRDYFFTGCGQYHEDALDCRSRPAPKPLSISPQVVLFAHSNPVLDFGRTADFYMNCFNIRSKVCDPEGIQTLLDRAQAVSSREARRLALEQLADIAHDEALFLPLFSVPVVYGMDPQLQWEPRSDGRVRINTMSFK